MCVGLCSLCCWSCCIVSISWVCLWLSGVRRVELILLGRFASLCVSTIAAWGAWRGRGNACGKGYKAVGEGLDEDEEDDNEAICGIDDVEKP